MNPLTIHPGRHSGDVCVHGTRVPAHVLAEHVWGGDGVDEVADWYDVTRTDVLLSCWWWVQAGHLAYMRGRRRKLWQEWKEHAHGIYGGWVTDVEVCDPDDFTDQPRVRERSDPPEGRPK